MIHNMKYEKNRWKNQNLNKKHWNLKVSTLVIAFLVSFLLTACGSKAQDTIDDTRTMSGITDSSGIGDNSTLADNRTDFGTAADDRKDSNATANNGKDSDAAADTGKDSDAATDTGKDSDATTNTGKDSDAAVNTEKDADTSLSNGNDAGTSASIAQGSIPSKEDKENKESTDDGNNSTNNGKESTEGGTGNKSDSVPSSEQEKLPPDEPATDDLEEADLDEDGVYTSKEDVAYYLYLYEHLPYNYITKKEAEKLGWKGGSLEPYAPGKCIGGSRFGNYEGLLPAKEGRFYTECDIDTLGASKRGAKRIVFSNDGLIYYTEDHYQTFELLYGEE